MVLQTIHLQPSCIATSHVYDNRNSQYLYRVIYIKNKGATLQRRFNKDHANVDPYLWDNLSSVEVFALHEGKEEFRPIGEVNIPVIFSDGDEARRLIRKHILEEVNKED